MSLRIFGHFQYFSVNFIQIEIIHFSHVHFTYVYWKRLNERYWKRSSVVIHPLLPTPPLQILYFLHSPLFLISHFVHCYRVKYWRCEQVFVHSREGLCGQQGLGWYKNFKNEKLYHEGKLGCILRFLFNYLRRCPYFWKISCFWETRIGVFFSPFFPEPAYMSHQSNIPVCE